MGNASEKAVFLFREGYSCSQAVFAAFSGGYGLDEQTAFRVASGFGGGVKCGEICGAASGAVMAVGLKYGCPDPKDKDARKVCGDKTSEFLRLFRARFTHLACRDLLGCDIATPEGRRYALENNLFRTVCVSLVADSANILEDLGY